MAELVLTAPSQRRAHSSALARMSCCPTCAAPEVDDQPGDFDPRAFVAALVCRACGHEWSVSC
ncbi:MULTISPECIES: hypothetical protein [unclassified Modestobacter]|nr:hypothetical protein A7K94_0220405 [Modestobacter sp. VKM Ac-2676]